MKMYISQLAKSASDRNSPRNTSQPNHRIRAGSNWHRNVMASIFIGLLSLVSFFSPLNQADAADRFNLTWSGNDSAEQTLYHFGRGLELPSRAGVLSENPVDATRRYLLTPQDRIGAAGDWTEYNQQILSVADNGEDRLVCVDTDQILNSLFLATTYGNWYVGAPLLSGRTTARGVWFCPNPYTMKFLAPGQQVQSRIKVVRQHFVNELVTTSWKNVEEKYLTMTISRVEDLSIAWNLAADSIITVDGNSTYGDRVGLVNGDLAPAGTEFRYASTELKYGEAEIIGDTPNTRNSVFAEDWPGWEKPSGDNLVYGTWYLSRDFDRFLFRPNSTALNQLTAGETVVSTLTVSWDVTESSPDYDPRAESTLTTKQISIELRGPKVELSISDVVNVVVEGDTALFKITADNYPNGGLDVVYEPFNFTGNFLDESYGASRERRTSTLFFSRDGENAPYTATLEVPTRRTPDIVENQGLIGVRLIGSPQYDADLERFIGTADISDSSVPILRITDAADIRPGETAYFPVFSNINPGQPLSVTYQPRNGSGDNFLNTSEGYSGANRTKVLNFSRSGNAEYYTAMLDVPTVVSNQSSGRISVRIVQIVSPTPSYVLARGPFDTEGDVMISDNPFPQLSIKNISAPINEGETATFAIGINRLPEQDLNVSFIPVNLGGNFLDIANGESGVQRTASLTFAQTDNGYTAQLEIPTAQPNRIDEEQGQISIELVESSGYSVSPIQSIGMVAVNDVDVPALSIDRSGSTVVGSQAVFTVTSNILPQSPLSVNYTPTNTIGEFIDTTGGDSGTTRSIELTFSQSQPYTAEISIPTVVSGRPGGEFTVTLAENESAPGTYELSDIAETQSATAVVSFPVPQLSIRAVNQPVTEGGIASFIIFTDTNPLSQLDVKFAASNEIGDFIDSATFGGGASQSLNFTLDDSTGIYMANLEIQTRAPNRLDEIDGKVSVELQASAEYALNSDSVQGTAVVYDADIPELSIFGGTKTEIGAAATFTIVSDILPQAAISVSYTPENETGQFLDPNDNTDGVSKSSTFTFIANESSGQFSAELVIPTVADPNLTSGVVTVTLDSDTAASATYSLAERSGAASISIGAFPIPELSVFASETATAEGETAMFTVSASANPVRVLQVLHTVSNLTGNFLDTTTGISSATRTANLSFVQSAENDSHTATIEVPTLAPNGVDEDTGMISLALEPSPEYTISNANASATADILDSDVPRLSIDAAEYVLVGQDAVFTVTSDLLPWQPLAVSYIPENTLGEFIDTSAGASGTTRSTNLAFSQVSPFTATIRVPTVAFDAPLGKFTVTLLEDGSQSLNYALSEVIDDQVAVTAVNYPAPELSITSLAPSITEGEAANFRITSSINPLRNLDVRYSITNAAGNFIDMEPENNSFSRSLEFFNEGDTSSFSSILEIQTRNPNGLDEVNGVVSIVLADSEDYNLSSNTFQATVSVIDADTPELYIVGGSDVIAGESSNFTIVSDIRPFEPLAVSYTPRNITGNFLDTSEVAVGVGNTSVLNFVIDEANGTYKAELAIPTANDPRTDIGIFTVTLNEDAGNANSYGLDSNRLTANNLITGSSVPELSVFAVDAEVTEGESLQFAVVANAAPESDLPVLHMLNNQSGSFLDTTGGVSGSIRTSLLTFVQSAENNEFTATIVVPTNAPNGIDEETGAISITLVSSGKYTINASNGSASVSVADAEVPRLSIDNAANVLIGENAIFTVTSDLQPWQNLSVTFVPENTLGEPIDTSEGASGAARTTILAFSESPPYTSTISIPTTVSSDSTSEFVVTLKDDSFGAQSYTLSTDIDSHSATATLNAGIPVISIHNIESPINEGDTATFKLSTNEDAIRQLVVSYSPSNSAGNFLKESLVGSSRTQSLEFTFDEETGQRTANLDIPTRTPNGQDEINGKISVELLPFAGYALDSTSFKAEVAVYDIDIPVLSFSGNTNASSGETAYLELVSDIRPIDSFSVSYTPANTAGQFLDASVINPDVRNASSLTFTWNEEVRKFTANLAIPTVDDPNSEYGAITVSLNDDAAELTTYSLAAGNRSARVTVNAAEIPELSIYSTAPEVTEGETIEFTVESNLNPMSTIQIMYIANNLTGGFLDTSEGNSGAPRSADLTFTPSNDGENYAATLEVPTNEVNGKDEENGSVNVVLLESSGYTIHPELNNATVSIVDADIPSLSINPVSDSVDAGKIAEFLVTSDILPLQELAVAYVPANDSGDFLDFAEGESGVTRTSTLQFKQNGESGSFGATIGISTRKIASNTNGTISVQLVDGQNAPVPYMVDQQVSLVTINLVPTVSIQAEPDSISIGGNIIVNFTALPAPSSEMRVRIAVEANGTISFFHVPRFVTFRAGQSTANLILRPQGNGGYQENGSVTIRITEISDSNYEIAGGANESEEDSIAVPITNAPSHGNGNEPQKYSVVSSIIREILLNNSNSGNSSENTVEKENQKIEISIAPVANEIVEGMPARFTIEASQPVRQDVTVVLQLSGSGNFIRGETAITEVLNLGSKSKSFGVETIDDDIPEQDGQVIVEITATTAYEISSNSVALVTVSDAMDREVERKFVNRINQEVLPLFFNSIQATAARSASDRVKRAFAGMDNSKFESDFQQLFKGLLQESGEFLEDNSALWSKLLDNSSFALNLSEESNASNPATVWALSDRSNVSEIGSENNNSLEGSIYSGQIGLETKSEEGVLFGLSTLVSNANITHRSQELGRVTFDALSASLHPYFGIKSTNDRFNFHSTVGIGLGSVDVDQSDMMLNSLNTNFYNSATGISQTLYKTDSILGGAGELSLAGETWHSGQFVEAENDAAGNFNATAHHYNFMLDGEHKSALAGGEMLLSTASVGFGGHTTNNRTQLGLELNNSVKFDNASGLRFSGMANTLLSQEHGISHTSNVSVKFDLNDDNLGLISNNTLKWTHAEDADNYHPEQDRLMGFNLFDPQREQMDSVSSRVEVGYGFKFPETDYTVTPFSVFGYSTPQQQEFLLGLRVNQGSNMAFEFEGRLDNHDSKFAGANFWAGGNVKW